MYSQQFNCIKDCSPSSPFWEEVIQSCWPAPRYLFCPSFFSSDNPSPHICILCTFFDLCKHLPLSNIMNIDGPQKMIPQVINLLTRVPRPVHQHPVCVWYRGDPISSDYSQATSSPYLHDTHCSVRRRQHSRTTTWSKPRILYLAQMIIRKEPNHKSYSWT